MYSSSVQFVYHWIGPNNGLLLTLVFDLKWHDADFVCRVEPNRTASEILYVPHFHHHHHRHNLKEILTWVCHNFELCCCCWQNHLTPSTHNTNYTVSFANKLATFALNRIRYMVKAVYCTVYYVHFSAVAGLNLSTHLTGIIIASAEGFCNCNTHTHTHTFTFIKFINFIISKPAKKKKPCAKSQSKLAYQSQWRQHKMYAISFCGIHVYFGTQRYMNDMHTKEMCVCKPHTIHNFILFSKYLL